MTHNGKLSRRQFAQGCAGMAGLAALASPAWAAAVSAGWAHATEQRFDVASIDRARVLADAARYLRRKPVTITAYRSSRSAGGLHDYYSEGDYWWPNPKDPNGPYIQRDGMTNPANFTAHRHALMRLSIEEAALAAAWKLTRRREYAEHAALHLRAWFLDPSTRMNPNLEYAQAIHGITTGRGIGIIDTIHLVEVARSIPFVEESGALSDAEQRGLRHWFSQYLHWMTTSPHGLKERAAKNNHGTCWVMQAAAFAAFVEDEAQLAACRERYRTVLLPHQMAGNGSFPLELRRTKPYGYSLFNLDAMATVCQILSTREDSLYEFRLPDGRCLERGVAWMEPYIADKGRWPYRHDVMYYQYWPIRQISLLFGGLAYRRPEWLALWQRLKPAPHVEEILRNDPIRQPVLWV